MQTGREKVTNEQRAKNLKKIAHAAVHIERTRGIPAELTAGQCIIESSWLSKCPGNNAFGIKWVSGPYTELPTKERINGEVITIIDRFAAYPTLEHGFEAYADLILKGRYFRDRFARYQNHKDLLKLLTDMSGADGQPPYFTGAGYVDLWQKIVNQANVKAALEAERRMFEA